jgi:hypothetical protein
MWIPNETGEKVKLSVYEISAGDHLVFYDTMGRKLRAGQHLSSDSIIAFKANTTGLQLLRGVYTSSHKKIAEIDAHRPAKRSSLTEPSDFESLPPALSLKHDRVGAPYSPFDFTPLKVHSAISYGMGDADGSFAWDAFTHDPAPWLLADASTRTSGPIATTSGPHGTAISWSGRLAFWGGKRPLLPAATGRPDRCGLPDHAPGADTGAADLRLQDQRPEPGR